MVDVKLLLDATLSLTDVVPAIEFSSDGRVDPYGLEPHGFVLPEA